MPKTYSDEEKEKITYYFKSYKAIGKLYKQNTKRI